ncbi:MAG: hypothetical protein AAFX02_03785 [Pseudomonadota bacterium]
MKILSLAGGTLIAASIALSGISALASNAGLTLILPGIPMIGSLGFVIAISLIALGVAVSTLLAQREWGTAAVICIFLALVGCGDAYTNFKAFASQVSAADQAAADRNTAYKTAVEALDRTRGEIDQLTASFELMQAQEPEAIMAAQTYLAGLGLYTGRIDGKRGPITLRAMRDQGGELRQRLADLKAAEAVHTATVSQGATVADMPFTMRESALYAVLLTLFSTMLSFIGGILFSTGCTLKDDVEEIEEALSETEANIIDLVAMLKSA